MILIAGLGNPGAKYAGNRHNIGFMAVDRIAARHRFPPFRKNFQAEVAEGSIAGERVLLMKPQTYMNESGRSVGEAARFLKITPDRIVVLHDELDLPPGKIRMKAGGGHGGHNGLRSISSQVTDAYRRLRLGIGHPGDKERVTGHVLGDFAKADHAWLDPLLDELALNAAMLVRGEDSQLMNKLALATGAKPDAPEKKPAAQSHIRPARNHAQPKALPTTGPMADMLKKLLGKREE